jgi:hypothetical protein
MTHASNRCSAEVIQITPGDDLRGEDVSRLSIFAFSADSNYTFRGWQPFVVGIGQRKTT